MKAKVLYPYEAVGEGEISISAADVEVRIIEDYENGWAFVELSDGRSGVFPMTYLEVIPEKRASVKPTYSPPPIPRSPIATTDSTPTNSPGEEEYQRRSLGSPTQSERRIRTGTVRSQKIQKNRILEAAAADPHRMEKINACLAQIDDLVRKEPFNDLAKAMQKYQQASEKLVEEDKRTFQCTPRI
eukprot:TRINITY_DN4539_c0_g1_i4.p1 TRINITY_DN4539_c0_g1~~TRINITY_DN4539_c0_g1_i4.p1  ORF type:complete len:186 (-),score=30.79 TRINITY_DN4539_c0_g1_i4:72-629(-)